LKANGNLAVDSNAVIAYWSGDARACAIVDGATILFLPAIVLGELIYGACNSVRRTENERTVRLFADHCSVLPVDGAVAEQYARIRVSLKKKGKPTPENDIWISAICAHYGVPLMTNDAHFAQVDLVKIVDWEDTIQT